MNIFDQINNEDIFDILGINEEIDEDIADAYAEQDARTLKEYGF
jgi:hypothetical protein